MFRPEERLVSLGARSRRSVTLLRVFLLASAAILLAGGLVLSWILTTSLRDQAIADRRESLSQYVAGVLRPAIVPQRPDRRALATPYAQTG